LIEKPVSTAGNGWISAAKDIGRHLFFHGNYAESRFTGMNCSPGIAASREDMAMDGATIFVSLCSGIAGAVLTLVYDHNKEKIKKKQEVAIELIKYIESLEEAKNKMLQADGDDIVWSADTDVTFLLWKKSPRLMAKIYFPNKTIVDFENVIEKFNEYKNKSLAFSRMRFVKPTGDLTSDHIMNQQRLVRNEADKLFEEFETMRDILVSELTSQCSFDSPKH